MSAREPIAIIGLGLRLPRADSLDQFWAHLRAGRSLISEVSPRRWDALSLRGDPRQGQKTNSIWGGFLEDADAFDAPFFNISPREASWMDPQQRYALEMAWKAMEDAGYAPSALAGSRTGVYMGVCHWDYAELIEKQLAEVDAYTPTGIAFSVIANRLSHHFDFCGPSITNDTACAASLTSVYEAVRALQTGECDTALAGGVNLCWSPNHFVAFSKAGMLSRDGASKAFDERADGYVRGEGGAMLLLKPLSAARADGDPIHAVIRGIGVNHGGRTSSLTVTNPDAQAALIAGVYREAGVGPADIDYIEAHGPGTPLGDPIEIRGLKQAFAELHAEAGSTPEAARCGVGSVKTNLGHLEGAAGVAGIAKVLAALGREELPGNVDFREQNRLIDLQGSDFRIQAENTPWPRDGDRPRRAGVSSFGFGGSNAHVLLEEGPAREAVQPDQQPVLLPLSARDEQALAALVGELLAFLEQPPTELNLADLAYTLQQGREAMASRLAVIAADAETLRGALRAWLAGEPHPALCRPDEPPAEDDALALALAAARWLRDETPDWASLWQGRRPRRIHAPGYVFMRQRYWIDTALAGKDSEAVPHPLLHRNVSGFQGPRYLSRLTGDEFYWAEHRVDGRQVLPGVVYLEMARAALQLADGLDGPPPVVFENVVWTRPILAAEGPVSIALNLRALDEQRVAYTIETPGKDPAAPASGNGQGVLSRADSAEPPAKLDLAALREATPHELEVADCYARLRASGMAHGPGFQVISRIRRGESGVLAQLKLGRPLQPSLARLPLQPMLLDAAIQAWIAHDDATPEQAAVPFACRHIQVHGPCEAVMWAWVRPAAGATADASLRRLDIDLCDKAGELRVAFRDLSLRAMAAERAAAPQEEGELRLLGGEWQERALGAPAAIERDTTVVLAGFPAELAEVLGRHIDHSVLSLPLGEDDDAERARRWFETLHEQLAETLRARPARRRQWLVLAPQTLPAALTAPLAALFKTAALETPRLEGAVLRLAGEPEVERLAAIIAAEHGRDDAFAELYYEADDRRRVWRPLAVSATEAEAPKLDPEAVYWITGGLGGLGQHFARWLIARGGKRIVLSGRREQPDDAAQANLEALRALGAEVHYRCCDLGNRAAVDELVAWIPAALGPLKGVIHAAGTLDDGLIFNKDPATLAAVLAPKLAGTLHLDEATAGLELDFLLLCSSIAAVFGNVGQADYAAANAFLGAYAEQREALRRRGARHGRTIAVAWPLWAEGGMGVDETAREALRARFGTHPLPTERGLRVLDQLLAAPEAGNRTVLYGDPARMDELLADYGRGGAPAATPAPVENAANDASLRARTLDYLKELLAGAAQLDAAQIKPNRKLEEYGLDSILIVEMTTQLEQELGSLSKTLFFEYVDLNGVADHLIAEHREALLAALGEEEAPEPESVSEPQAEAVPLRRDAEPVARTLSADSPERTASADQDHDIAIVGLSLRVAKAADQQAFWDLLSQGLHGFEAYPADRWNHQALLHPERDVLGKTVVRTGAFLDGVDEFDPRYFRISQYEAELMSPEVRLFLQSSVEAFEDAGYSREYMQSRYGGDVAVIVGSMTNEYDLFGFQNMLMRGALASGSYTGTVPNMVSYYYGFTGPSYFLDTMCSAAATCVHEAVHMLRAGRCRMALAGGVSLLLHPQKLIATSQEHFTSKTADVIRGYGLGADGTILGEGVGALVLKTLSEAERDGDHIYGVIKGTGVTNAGVRNGFTVPNPAQQAEAIERALRDGGVDPRSIGYLEGHGSGTSLGDPIEIKALTRAWGKYTEERQFCPIGTVKSNIAHLLGASGLAGIAKVLMQLKHGQLAPSLHAETLNPNIPFEQTPFYVQRELAPWPRLRDERGGELPRRAGVTSIGAGGMNSHIIIEEHIPGAPGTPPARGPELLVFSAMNEARLRLLLERFQHWLGDNREASLSDIAWTLQVGRNELPCRLALVVANHEALEQALADFLATGAPPAGGWYSRNILERDPEEAPEQLREDTAARRLDRVARAWTDGLAIDWDALNAGRAPRRLSLPAYPFERVRCWYQEYPDAPSVVNPLGSSLKLHPLIGANRSDLSGLRYDTAIHLNELLDYVYRQARRQHLLTLAPVEACAALARIAGLQGPLSLQDLRIHGEPDWTRVSRLEAALDPAPAGGWRLSLGTVDEDGERRAYAEAELLEQAQALATLDLPALRAEADERLEGEAFYAELARLELDFKPYLEVVERVHRLADGGLLCEWSSAHPQQDFYKRNLQLPPAALAAAQQALAWLAGEGAASPVAALSRLRLLGGEMVALHLRPESGGAYELSYLAADGAVLARLEGLRLAGQGGQEGPGTAEAAPSAAPQDKPERLALELRALAADMLKFPAEELSLRESFQDLGFDSISLTRLANEISADYGLELSPAVFFEAAHLEALSEHLVMRHGASPRQSQPRPAEPAGGQAAERSAPLTREPVIQSRVSRPEPALPGPDAEDDAVAIIGMAARFPGSADVDSFFEHLLAGHDLIADLPLERYGPDYRARIMAADFVPRGGFLDDIARFDAELFRISPVEAERMDPQQRLLLETAWRALEDSGYQAEELPRDTGVFVGVSSLDYADLLRAHGVPRDGYAATGNSLAMVANRLSHYFDLHGPSQSLDTACSSSLVALLRAAEAVRAGRCSAALVGGVNLALSLEGFLGPQQAGMLSPGGRCRSFGQGADGYVRGEGVAALLLKPLAQARREGDRILGVLRGGAENHGGRAGSLTAPSTRAQAELVQGAMAGIDPASIGYLEAHGTGTALGDPVELNGLRQAYQALGLDASAAPIPLGSVKSNIGHLEAAAGLAGVIKVLLAMRHGELPASLHCQPPNPHLELGDGPFELLHRRRPWPRRLDAAGGELPRRAGVSSFGFGGANAHVVLEEPPEAHRARRQPLPPRRFADTRFWLRGVSSGADREPAESAGEGSETVVLNPVWRPEPLRPQGSAAPRRLVLACELEDWPRATAEARVLGLPRRAGDMAQRYTEAAAWLLEILQGELRDADRSPMLLQLLVPLGDERALYSGLAALLETAAAENPHLAVQLIELDTTDLPGELDTLLAEEARGARASRVRYRQGRWVRQWVDAPLPASKDSPWRAGGVVLISGGMGALGRALARDIAHSTPGCVLVLAGSGELDAPRAEFIEELRALGATAGYRQLDIADSAAVDGLVKEILEVHGGLHAVVHCAGTLRDGYLPHKRRADLEAVLAPKAAGVMALLQACRDIELDRFVLYSSLAGAVGNPGQADYAAANGFLDALAEHRGAPLLSVNWPLWRDGGMGVDAATEHALYRRMGQRPLNNSQGLEALRRLMAGNASRAAVIAGEPAAIRAFFDAAGRAAEPEPGEQSAVPAAERGALLAPCTARLRELFARVSGTPAERIAVGAELSDYGIDSLMIVRLNEALAEHFGALPKTLLFEHRTLGAVADYLLDAHATACRRWLGVTDTPAAPPASAVAATPAPLAGTPDAAEPIAVIGMSGRYPGAADLQQFWRQLACGEDAIGEVPAERWPLEDFFEPDPDAAVAGGKSYSRWGGFLDGFADFDPRLFKIAPRDCAAMDPQERLFLMSAWEACEDAGYSPTRLAARHGSRVGVYAGVTKTGWALHGPFTSAEGARVRPRTSFASVANRVSHVLGLRGPSVPVDTMCSSSLTAVHQACEQLRAGECELALAGGVNLYLHPAEYVDLCASRMLAADGRCKSFGLGGDGFVPGEGVGCLLLKPLSRALADGDRIHALIRGSAVNHGGRSNGYTVPKPGAQREVVSQALARAGVRAEQLSYIEAHGTGTALGDPIELRGLTEAFAEHTERRGFCALGSVKSVIGHLEAAAGIAGLSKVILQMQHRQLTPTLHAAQPNPDLDLDASPFVLQQQLAPWRAERLLAGVSSFGAGGANAHLIVEAWPEEGAGAAQPETGIQVVPLSARDPARLRAYAERLLAFLEQGASAPALPAELPARLRDYLAHLLSVSAEDIDPAEPFENYGVEPAQRLRLRGWLQREYGLELDEASLGPLVSIEQLLAELGREHPTSRPAPPLADIAYTLQLGREAMEARLGIEAATREELAQGLRDYLAGRLDRPGLHVAVCDAAEAVDRLLDEDELRELAQGWLAQGKAGKLLRLWVRGLNIDWEALARPNTPRIVSLPCYPFAKERYWLPERAEQQPVARALQDAAMVAGREALLADDAALEARLAVLLRPILDQLPASLPERGERWRAAARALLDAHPALPRLSLDAAWADWADYKRTCQAAGAPLAQITLAETALRELPAVLRGERAASAVMFPAGSMGLVEGVYKDNAVATRFNAALAAAAAAFVAQRAGTAGRALRILEIGAGTGGTTEVLLDALEGQRAHIAEYRYTDLSRAFLIHAERHYADRAPGLTTALFDVEQPLAGQAVVPGGYDLVIAANVLHATADMARTLSVVGETLAPGGLLLINETSRPGLFTHVTFGLLEGWWRFTDPERRIPGTPSLSAESWRALLDETGLRWLAVSPEAERALGQQIIAATAPAERGGQATPAARSEERSLAAAAPKPAVTISRPTGAASGGLREVLLRALGETLNVAPSAIDPTQSFADYGLDSILGAELVHRLREALGIELSHTRLFDYSNVLRLEGMLAADYPELVAQAVEAPETTPQAPRVDEAPTRAMPRPADAAREPIAIVGASGRFAGAAGLDELWEHLREGRDLVEPVSRFDLSPFYRDAPADSYGRHGSFLDGIDRFDPVFFGISGLEAKYMDPQQRLFLEEAWKTLENAGHAGADMTGRRCGVFVGCSAGDYQELFREQPPGQAFWGNTSSLIPARIAYHLDLKGPAIAVDTACSSSLVAVHLACQSLWNGESELALAGGVFVQCTPRFYRYANQARMLSPSGRCAAFGEGADGIVPGEAVAAVLLRPLSQALADGDTIHGVIVGSGINQDGATNGITAPSAASQERLIRQVYEDFAIDPAGIGLVEAHGTGTVLGDPIEHEALSRAFAAWTDQRGYCALGSIKSNIGHATTAAGAAGLIKLLLAMKHRTLPPSIHVGAGNPAIDFDQGAFYLNRQARAWEAPGQGPRRAAISSFGFSGTNAHLVLEEGPERPRETPSAPAWLFVLSARTEAQLRDQARNLLAWLRAQPEAQAADVAHTLMIGRRHFAHRLALVAEDLDALDARLAAWLDGDAKAVVGVAALDELPVAGAADIDEATETLIASLRRGELDWREGLGQLAERYLRGETVPYTRLLPEARRIPLPAYPFAATSCWVDEAPKEATEQATKTLAAAAEGAVQQTTVTSAGRVRLTDPAAPASPPVPAAPIKVRLAPLEVAPRSEVTLHQADPAEGVRSLTLHGDWSVAAQARLDAELAQAAADETVRVVLVRGVDRWTAQGAAAPSPAALDCAVPVVLALPAGAEGAGLAFALGADFLLLAEEARYGRVHTESGPAADPARDLLAEGTPHTGAALRAAGSGLRVLPAAELDAAAHTLARQIAQAPRLALTELKSHMRHGESLTVDAPAERQRLRELAAQAAASPASPGRVVPLASPVVELEAFEDGVVLLRMLEREHKNTFTPAFMEGLQEAFGLIRSRPDFKVVVLSGFDGYFACGGTRDGLRELQRGDSRFTDLKIYNLPLECELPVIGAMQGHAIGAGWSLGMFCDLSLFSAESVYHSNYLWYGFTPGAGATLIFPSRFGDELGREVLFSAREYKGRELAARQPGLMAHPSAEVLPRALAMAHALAGRPRDELLRLKAALAAPLQARLEGVFARELAMHQRTFVDNPRVMARIEQAFGAEAPAAETAGPVAADRAGLRQALVASLAEELMIAPAEIRDSASFLELGLDSILALTWIRRLNAELEIELPATAVYAHPTVGALVDHVTGLRPGLPAAEADTLSAPEQPPAPVVQPAEESSEQDLRSLRPRLIASLAEELMIAPEEIRDGASFLELGLDSILALTWIRRLNAELGIELPATAVYAHPTVGALLSQVARLLPREAEEPARQDAPPVRITPTPAQPSERASGQPGDQPSEPTPAPVMAARPERSAPEGAVAIIGASGRYPRAADLQAYWENLQAGRDCISEVPPQRWDIARHYHPDPQQPNASYCKWMGYIDEVELFDPQFFNITPREAELMDPQQRLFLEHAWHALEDAALDPRRLAGSQCGVFVGSGPSGYADRIDERNAYSLLGSSGSILAARIAHLLDLQGPCISLDTACSSSLVAIAEACNSLLLGDSDLALAGGACVLIGPSMFIDTAKVGMLSADGRCFSFDERANGFVPGEGVGVLLLKRLEDAERDGDPIRAVIRGWGVNQDGKTNGITAPNPQAQTRLLRKVYRRFDIDPASIGLVETHGTGTPLGDPIEIEGLRDAYADDPRRDACALGSVKSNVGHLLAAAGVAGASKAMLALEQAELPPSINFQRLNPHIRLDDTPFYLNTEARPWTAPDKGPRRAAVSSFGFSGTNAHLVLEEYPRAEPAAQGPGPWLFTLSARDETRLQAGAAALERHVVANPRLNLEALAYTLQVARTDMEARLAFVYHDRESLLRALGSVAAGQPLGDVHRGRRDEAAVALFESDPDARALPEKWLRTGTAESLDRLAGLWVRGLSVDWPALVPGGYRLRLPGYCFARERHWVEAPVETATASAPKAPAQGVVSRRPHETIPQAWSRAGARLLSGLFLPELARAMAEQALGRPLRAMKHLVWGAPLPAGEQPPAFELVSGVDQDGEYFHVRIPGAEQAPCLLAETVAEDELPAWPPALAADSFRGEDLSIAHERFAAGLDARDGELPGTLRVTEVYRREGELLARLEGCGGEGLAPALLERLWRLLAFREGGEPRFPYAIEALRLGGQLPETLLARLWQPAEDAPPSLALYTPAGEPCLLLQGVLTREAEELDELRIDDEVKLG